MHPLLVVAIVILVVFLLVLVVCVCILKGRDDDELEKMGIRRS